jgi:hypothetical protein
MVRWLVIGGVAAIALTVYALVDLFITGKQRFRAFPRPVWIALIVVLPIIGPVLWLTIGKNSPRTTSPRAPDDDPSFLGSLSESADERIKRLEEELRKLDDEDDPDSSDSTPPKSS